MKSPGYLLLAILFLPVGLVKAAEGETNSKASANQLQIAKAWGWLLAQNENVSGIPLTPDESATFLKGFWAGCTNQPLPYESKIFPDVEQLAKARRAKPVQVTIEKNRAQADAFIATLKSDTNVISLPENTYCRITKPGAGPAPQPAQTVTVNYVAQLVNGTEFSQAGPVDLVLVTNRSLCRGWMAAVQRLKPGGTMKLYVPPPLNEEQAAQWGVEPGAMMIFDVELLAVKDTAADDLANALIPPPPDVAPDVSGYNSSQIIEAWGWETARKARISLCELDSRSITALAGGFASAVAGRQFPPELQQLEPQVAEFVREKRTQAQSKARQQRTAQMQALFADLKRNTNVVELPDGLRYEILKPGTGAFPKDGQTVVVNYVGHLIDNTVFDKTMSDPMHIVVGSVLHGWNEGIQKINPGGKIRLYIPPSLGYGEEAVSGIPAGSTLIFEIELLDIQN